MSRADEAFALKGIEFRALDELAKFRVSEGVSYWKVGYLVATIGCAKRSQKSTQAWLLGPNRVNMGVIITNFVTRPKRDSSVPYNLSQLILFITEFAVRCCNAARLSV